MGVTLPPPPLARTRLPSTRSLIHLFTLVVVIGGVAAFAWNAAADRKATIAEAETSLAEIARLMEEHTSAVLHINALQMHRVTDLIGGRPLGALRGSVPDWQALNRILADSPMGHSLWIFDAEGDLVLTSVQPDGMVLNVRDREYFYELKAGGGPFVISPLITGRLTGGLLFPVAQRLVDAEGRFAGVVALSIRADYFLDFYQALRPEASSIFTLVRTDGTVVLRSPLPAQPVNRESALRSVLFERSREAPVGTYRTPSIFDGMDRIVAYRTMEKYPLLVAAGMAADAVLADWIGRTLRNGAFTLGGLALLLALSLLARRSADAETHALARYESEARALAGALKVKDVLFQEIHHRVKNNLQIVSSMLMMQSLQIRDDTTRAALQLSLDRIHSMGLVHQTLYLTNEAARVDMVSYLGDLAASLGATYGAAERGITLAAEADEGGLELDQAVPLGLLANEVLTNALKHAFPQGRGGTITVALRRADRLVRFFVQDDGIGRAEGSREGVGMTLIRALAGQLQAELTIDNDTGCRIALTFLAKD